jgi:hypothetical protein
MGKTLMCGLSSHGLHTILSFTTSNKPHQATAMAGEQIDHGIRLALQTGPPRLLRRRASPLIWL